MSIMPVPVPARQIKAGDVITVHPDTGHPVEYRVTADAHLGEFGAVHIDYADGDGLAGELVEVDPDMWITTIPAGGLYLLAKDRKETTR